MCSLHIAKYQENYFSITCGSKEDHCVAQDVNSTEADIMAVVQKPINISNLAEKSGPPAWKQLPTWFQVSENDRIIPPAAEHILDYDHRLIIWDDDY